MIHFTQCAFDVRTDIDDCQLSKLRQILSKAFDQIHNTDAHLNTRVYVSHRFAITYLNYDM